MTISPLFLVVFSALYLLSPSTFSLTDQSTSKHAEVAAVLPSELDKPFVQLILIPMRDGVSLPADLYLPNPQAKNLPCILARTPYGRALHAEEYIDIARDGFAVVVQDMRSSLDAEGKTFPYFTDAWGGLQDGYDTVEWLAKQSFTNGKIGTSGISARGIAQNMLAPSAPPHLVCQHIGFAPAGLYEALFQSGVLQKNLVEGWFARYASNPSILNFVQAHDKARGFWAQYDSALAAMQITTPALHYGGWYDLFLQGTLKAFLSRQLDGGEGAKGKQTLVIGPWNHHWNHGRGKGPKEWPEQGYNPPVDISLSKWMQHQLKDEKVTIPAVTYYVMGPLDDHRVGHVWKQNAVWPIPAENTSWYLHQNGLLDTTGDKSCEKGLTFAFNPEKPVETIGGRNLFLPSGPLDQRLIEAREDVLTFTSKPLEKDTEVTGPLEAFIFAQPGSEYMDVVVRLTDVYPDGRSLLISEGLTRVHTKNLEEAQPQEVHVDLWATSQVFAKGHSIRVSISASHFPKYSLPPSGNAQHTLFFGENTPSRVVLPFAK